MNILLTILCYAFLCVVAIVVFLFLVFLFQYIVMFMFHKCKHCHHGMDYRGLKEDDENGHYLFHCTKCGAWEQVPREEFFRKYDKQVES